MDKDLNNSVTDNSPNINESETNKSFVGKFKSHVSGIINNTPLSKWFRRDETSTGSSIRRRTDDDYEDDELYQMQPPTKRQKLPTDSSQVNNPRKLNLSDTPITKNSLNIFPEPVAGPSGIVTSKKLLERTTQPVVTACSGQSFRHDILKLNGHKESDSEESTSGYSSVARIGSKEQVCESRDSSKQTSPLEHSPKNTRTLFPPSNMNRSLFSDRSPNLNSSLSSRRPTFNATLFGSPNFLDKTLSTKRIINSPFYNGRTIYGGASAYSRQFDTTRTSLRNSVQIKPINKTNAENGSNNLALGKTARRILDTLEQYSTPVNDAKKIPVKKMRSNLGGMLTKYTGANPYLICDNKKVASNKELQVPSVTDLLKMKQRERLQDSTESVRQIASTSKSVLNTETYKLPINDVEQQPKHTNKMKTKLSTVRQKCQENETVQDIPLKAVPLPITTLPKFDINVLPPTTQPQQQQQKQPQKKQENELKNLFSKTNPVPVNKETEIIKTSSKLEYKFSEPIIIAENLKSIIAINNFKFSEPICKKSRKDMVTMNFKMPENKLTLITPNKSQTITTTTTTCNSDAIVKPATELIKTGSVMDILGKKEPNLSLIEKFKSAEGTWECSVCLIRNNPEKEKCAACESIRVNNKKEMKNNFSNNDTKLTNTTTTVGLTTPNLETKQIIKQQSNNQIPTLKFGDKFKTPADTWECNTCMIRNKNELIKCAACESPRPINKNCTDIFKANSLKDKFKPPSDTWECSVCMIRNKNDLNKCAACNNENKFLINTPSSSTTTTSTFGSDFKIKDSEWECSTCMVRNKMSSNKCLCCETPKPGSNTKPSVDLETSNKPIPSFSFGVDKSVTSSFTFGIPPNKTATTTSSSVSLIFGQTTTTSTTTTPPPATKFVFGIQTQSSATTNNELKQEKNKQNLVEKPTDKVIETVTKSETAAASLPILPVNTPHNDSKKNISNEKPTFNFQPSSLNGDLNNSASLLNSKVNEPKTNTLKPELIQSSITQQNLVTQQTSSDTTKPLFQFGGKTDSNKPPSMFGAPPTVAKVDKSLNNGFGATNPTFGSSTTFPTFGASSSSATPQNVPQTSKVTPVQPAFSFGSVTNTEQTNKTELFSFGQTTPQQPLKPPQQQQPQQSTFSFGSNAPNSSVAAPQLNFSFGSNSKTDTTTNNSFGNSKNGIFNFGSAGTNNNNNQKAGFNFGATTTTNQSTLFNFGANSTTSGTPAQPPSTGSFSFSAAPPSFDANVKPTFNFTDGNNITAFNAPPAPDGIAAPRKIKRAVRRAQR